MSVVSPRKHFLISHRSTHVALSGPSCSTLNPRLREKIMRAKETNHPFSNFNFCGFPLWMKRPVDLACFDSVIVCYSKGRVDGRKSKTRMTGVINLPFIGKHQMPNIKVKTGSFCLFSVSSDTWRMMMSETLISPGTCRRSAADSSY